VLQFFVSVANAFPDLPYSPAGDYHSSPSDVVLGVVVLLGFLSFVSAFVWAVGRFRE